MLVKQACMTNKLHSQGTHSEKMCALLKVNLGHLENYTVPLYLSLIVYSGFRFYCALLLQSHGFTALQD